ncbi:MAG: biopolymer transporter ExbD [Deltaproteobacteria bacterium]|nr:biopolymer transporter ExbD [Deltaproteobacteria bacterium]
MRSSRALVSACALALAGAACASSPPPPPDNPPIVVPVASVPPMASSAQPAIGYDLPRAADFMDVQPVLAVDVSATGELRVNGAPIAEERLKDAAREALSKAPEVRAVIRADASVTYGRVIRVMDLLKQGGISRIAFAVAPAGK